MRAHPRLPSRERRGAIIAAVRTTFAEKGFDRTTTRELARAAGVSEALLYKHFPSKESLHAAMLEACAASPELAEFGRALALQPSTAALVRLVHLLVSHFVLSDDPAKVTSCRLALRSLLEDGAFARLGAERLAATWARRVDACVRAAAQAGDVAGPPAPGGLHGWFAHHLAVGLMLHLLPPIPPVDYGLLRPALVAHAVRFVLRGPPGRGDPPALSPRHDFGPAPSWCLGRMTAGPGRRPWSAHPRRSRPGRARLIRARGPGSRPLSPFWAPSTVPTPPGALDIGRRGVRACLAAGAKGTG